MQRGGRIRATRRKQADIGDQMGEGLDHPGSEPEPEPDGYGCGSTWGHAASIETGSGPLVCSVCGDTFTLPGT
jgi:hypothetical protein